METFTTMKLFSMLPQRWTHVITYLPKLADVKLRAELKVVMCGDAPTAVISEDA